MRDTPPAPLAAQPIPYQGSKRRLAPRILARFPRRVGTLYEPFAGSAAVSLAAVHHGRVERLHLNDSLAPLMGIWRLVRDDPERLAAGYERLWRGQRDDPVGWFAAVRHRYNARPGPAELLFLLARCVKNAVRFNAAGAFNQAPDRRRRGTRPERMRARILAAHGLLRDRTTIAAGDYEAAIAAATPADLVYLDPPYQGTSSGRDRRYHEQLDRDRFLAALADLRARRVPFLLSYDGRCGDRTYGPALPAALGLERIDLPAGRSSQATLSGRAEETVESLYVSPDVQR